MFRTLLICAVVSASALGCSGTPQPRPDATRTATAAAQCSQPNGLPHPAEA